MKKILAYFETVSESFRSGTALRVAANRLLVVWIPLSFVMGAVAWYYEVERFEERVMRDAVHDAERIQYADLERYYHNEINLDDLHILLQRLLNDSDFVSAEIYSGSKKEIIREVGERAAVISRDLWDKAEDMQIPDYPYTEITNADRVTAIATAPIKDALGNINGYLKGICVVKDGALSEMKEDSVGAALISITSTLLTMMIIFPIIIALQRMILVQAKRILEGNFELLEVLGNAVAQRDSDTDTHNYRVTLYALTLAKHIKLHDDIIRVIMIGSFLHDIGKIGISDAILLKPGKLTAEEFEVMKSHVTIGVDILRNSSWVSQAISIVGCHHEKFDGTGYPNGIKGESIPLEARLFAIVDVFDALTTRRPYKEPRSLEESLQIMRHDNGRHFDPAIFAGFEEVAERMYQEIGTAPYENLRKDLLHEAHKYIRVDG